MGTYCVSWCFLINFRCGLIIQLEEEVNYEQENAK